MLTLKHTYIHVLTLTPAPPPPTHTHTYRTVHKIKNTNPYLPTSFPLDTNKHKHNNYMCKGTHIHVNILAYKPLHLLLYAHTNKNTNSKLYFPTVPPNTYTHKHIYKYRKHTYTHEQTNIHTTIQCISVDPHWAFQHPVMYMHCTSNAWFSGSQ